MPSPMSATTGGSTVQASVAPRERSPGAVATRMHGSTKYWDVAAKAGMTGAKGEGNQLAYQGYSACKRRGSGVLDRARNPGAQRRHHAARRGSGSGTRIRTRVN